MKWVSLTIIILLLFCPVISASPITYEISGHISRHFEGGGPPPVDQYVHPHFYEGMQVTGFLNWDTELFPDYSAPHNTPINMNGITFLQLTMADAYIEIGYNYYDLFINNGGTQDSIGLTNTGTQLFDFKDQSYILNTFQSNFYGSPNIFNDNSYPTGFDFSMVESGIVSTPIHSLYVDGVSYAYHNFFEITFDRFEAVPEPSTMLILSAGIACLALLRFRSKKFLR